MTWARARPSCSQGLWPYGADISANGTLRGLCLCGADGAKRPDNRHGRVVVGHPDRCSARWSTAPPPARCVDDGVVKGLHISSDGDYVVFASTSQLLAPAGYKMCVSRAITPRVMCTCTTGSTRRCGPCPSGPPSGLSLPGLPGHLRQWRHRRLPCRGRRRRVVDGHQQSFPGGLSKERGPDRRQFAGRFGQRRRPRQQRAGRYRCRAAGAATPAVPPGMGLLRQGRAGRARPSWRCRATGAYWRSSGHRAKRAGATGPCGGWSCRKGRCSWSRPPPVASGLRPAAGCFRVRGPTGQHERQRGAGGGTGVLAQVAVRPGPGLPLRADVYRWTQ